MNKLGVTGWRKFLLIVVWCCEWWRVWKRRKLKTTYALKTMQLPTLDIFLAINRWHPQNSASFQSPCPNPCHCHTRACLGRTTISFWSNPPPLCWGGRHFKMVSRPLDAPRWVAAALPFLPFQRILVSRKWGSPDAIACPIAPPLLTKTDTKADTWTERESWVTWPASGSEWGNAAWSSSSLSSRPFRVHFLTSFLSWLNKKCFAQVNWY